jgi:hypothetical protein
MATVEMIDAVEGLNIQELEGLFRAISDPRDKAEIAFVLGYHYHTTGRDVVARTWGNLSIELFKQCDTSTEVKCCPVHCEIGGIRLPDRIHEGVVKFHMEHYWKITP